MVLLTRILGYAKKINVQKPVRNHLKSGFVDILTLRVKAGSGGCGLPRYGGIGGNGGSIYVRGKEDLDLRTVGKIVKGKMVVAGMGGNSTKNGIIGKAGLDVTVDVPCGVSIKTTRGVHLGEINEADSKLLVAKGGIGGNADNGFCGEKGQIHTLILDLKLIADVALVGFPNAGKSTLLKAVSGSKTKVASYPFTTIKPHIGMMNYEDDRSIKMADLPGLIEGAHYDIGMGHKFLKHLERCKLLLFVVDIQGFQLSYKYTKRTCLETILLLNKEIELYKEDLLNTPAMLLINKMDTKDAQQIYEDIRPKLDNLAEFAQNYDETFRPERMIKFEKIIATSLLDKSKDNISKVKDAIREVMDDIERSKDKVTDFDYDLELYRKLKTKTKQFAEDMI